jgi:hypothetical protein
MKPFKTFILENKKTSSLEILSKNFYVGDDEPNLQYHIELSSSHIFVVYVPLKVNDKENISVKTSSNKSIDFWHGLPSQKGPNDTIRWKIYARSKKDLKSLLYYTNSGVTLNKKEKGILSNFYKDVIDGNIKEYNDKINFGDNEEVKDTFGDIYNEL